MGHDGDKIALTEKDFERQVRDLAKLFGWKYYHPFLSKWSERGFPDVTLVRPPRIIFAELKSEKGKVSPAQQEWLDLLGNVGDKDVQVYIWRPSQIEEIVEVLR